MLCQKPFYAGVQECPCGQCMPCRINRRRVWTARLLLESQLHLSSCFLTLTYSESSLPADGSLQIRHYQLFLKRLRRAIAPRKVSYYVVGEYGGITGRPHYHIVLFGIGVSRSGLLVLDVLSPEDDKLIFNSWGYGNIHVSSLTEASLSYCCKHLTKGLKNDVREAFDKLPEFCRMSLRPAIGALAVDNFSDFLLTSEGCYNVHLLGGDAPTGFRMENKIYPFGRYLRKRIRDRVGLDEVTSRVSRLRLQMERAESNVRLGARRLKSIRRADGVKAKFWSDVQKTRSKL